MNRKPLIIIACNNGIASSHAAAARLKEIIRKRNLGWEVKPVMFSSLTTEARYADVLASIAPFQVKVDIPVVSGMPFYTGVGLEKAIEEIQNILKERGFNSEVE